MSKSTIHLRSIYPSYRIDLKGQVDGKTKSVGAVQFSRNCASVDARFEEQLRANPSYGSDFWIENPEAVQKGMSPDPEGKKAAGGESENGDATGDTGANGEGQAEKTQAPMTAAEKKAANKAAKEAAKAAAEAEAKGDTKS